MTTSVVGRFAIGGFAFVNGAPAIINMGSRVASITSANAWNAYLSNSIHTSFANRTESEIVATTLGNRSIDSPRSRITAIIQAAISKAPFSRWLSTRGILGEQTKKVKLSDGAVSGLPVTRA